MGEGHATGPEKCFQTSEMFTERARAQPNERRLGVGGKLLKADLQERNRVPGCLGATSPCPLGAEAEEPVAATAEIPQTQGWRSAQTSPRGPGGSRTLRPCVSFQRGTWQRVSCRGLGGGSAGTVPVSADTGDSNAQRESLKLAQPRTRSASRGHPSERLVCYFCLTGVHPAAGRRGSDRPSVVSVHLPAGRVFGLSLALTSTTDGAF